MTERIDVTVTPFHWTFQTTAPRCRVWFRRNGYNADGHRVQAAFGPMLVRVLEAEGFRMRLQAGPHRPQTMGHRVTRAAETLVKHCGDVETVCLRVAVLVLLIVKLREVIAT